MLSLNLEANASKVAFVKLDRKIYEETEPQNYTMYKESLYDDGINFITSDDDSCFFMTHKCGQAYIA